MTVALRRRREGKTDYKKRLKLLASGKARFVVRKSNKNVISQIVSYSPEGDRVIVSGHTNELKKYGWDNAGRNIPAAYLTGYLCGVKAKEQNIKEAILDMGIYPSIKGSLIYAALKGAIDAGLNIVHDESVFPSQERIEGQHIMKNETTKFTKTDNKNVPKKFHEVKDKITKQKGKENEKRT